MNAHDETPCLEDYTKQHEIEFAGPGTSTAQQMQQSWMCGAGIIVACWQRDILSSKVCEEHMGQ